jgi:hypothetical protein
LINNLLEAEMNTRSTLIGMGTGILLIVLMVYPLYVVLPGEYIPEWGSGSAQLVWGLRIAAGIATLVGGLLAALYGGCRSRWQGMQRGASAGLLAGMTLFMGLGAAAAGTAGSGILLSHGPHPAADDLQMYSLLVESVVRTGWWTYQVLWLMLLGGGVLGGFGGILAPPQAKEIRKSPETSQIRVVLAVAFTLASVLNYVVSVAVFSLLPKAIQDAADQVGFTPSLAPEGIFTWATATAQIVFLLAMIWLISAVRREEKSQQPENLTAASVAGYVGGLTGLCVVILMFFINRPFVLSWFFIPGGVFSLVLGLTLLLSGIALGRRARQAAQLPAKRRLWPQLIVIGYPVLGFIILSILANFMDATVLVIIGGVIYLALLYWLSRREEKIPTSYSPSILEPGYWRRNWLQLSLGSTLAIMLPTFAGMVQAALNLVMIPVKVLPVLTNYGPDADPNLVADFTSVSLVKPLFAVQAQSALMGFVVLFIITSVSVGLAAFFFQRLRKRRAEVEVEESK